VLDAVEDAAGVRRVREVDPIATTKIPKLAAVVLHHDTESSRPEHVGVVSRIARHQHLVHLEAPPTREVLDGATLRSANREQIEELVMRIDQARGEPPLLDPFPKFSRTRPFLGIDEIAELELALILLRLEADSGHFREALT
jgi:hypothetical protein